MCKEAYIYPLYQDYRKLSVKWWIFYYKYFVVIGVNKRGFGGNLMGYNMFSITLHVYICIRFKGIEKYVNHNNPCSVCIIFLDSI